MYGNTIQVNHPLVISAQQGYQFSLTNVALDPDSQKALLFAKIGDKKILISELDRATGCLIATNLSIDFQSNTPVHLETALGNIHLIGNFKSCPPAKNISLQAKFTQSNPITETVPIQQSSQQTLMPSAPLRRSTRMRTPASNISPVTTNSRKKKDHALSDMAAYFKLSAKDLQNDQDDDQQAAFDKSQLEQESDSDSSSSDETPEANNKGEEHSEKNNQRKKPQDNSSMDEEKENEEEGEVRKRRKVIGEMEIGESGSNFTRPTKNPYD